MRLGCLLSGCCFGVRSDVVWAVRFPAQTPAWHAHLAAGLVSPASHTSLPVHPLQLYFMMLSLFAAVVAWRVRENQHRDGHAILAFLAIDGLGKALLETLRAEPPPGIQLASMLSGAVAGGLLVICSRSRVLHGQASVRLASLW